MVPKLLIKSALVMNTSVLNGQSFGLFVGSDLDKELLLGLQSRRVGQGLITNFVQGIRRIGNQLTKKNFLVGVESVDDQAHQLSDLGLKSEGLNSLFRHLGFSLDFKFGLVGYFWIYIFFSRQNLRF